MAISPASILITNESRMSNTGGRLLAVRRSAPRRLWIFSTTPSVTWRFTFLTSNRTGARDDAGGGGVRGGLSTSGSISAGEADGVGVAFVPGASAAGEGAAGVEADGDEGSALAGAGAAAGFARAGVDGFVECQKQPKDAPAINVTMIARKDTTVAPSINHARSRLTLSVPAKSRTLVPCPGRAADDPDAPEDRQGRQTLPADRPRRHQEGVPEVPHAGRADRPAGQAHRLHPPPPGRDPALPLRPEGDGRSRPGRG